VTCSLNNACLEDYFDFESLGGSKYSVECMCCCIALMREVLGGLYKYSLSYRSENNGRRRVTMSSCGDLFVVLAMILAFTVIRPTYVATAASVTDEDKDYEDPSVNEVDKNFKPPSARDDDAEINNRIPVIFSDLSDIERALSADGSVTGSGELKLTGEHAHSTTSSGETNVRLAPKYMLDLYNKFSKDKYSHPMANIVRSFQNMNTGNL